MAGWVAEDEAGIAGFLVARHLGEESEVLNLAVRGDSRRRGVGTGLLEAALGWSKSQGARRVILEVRASNVAALKFYERSGFRMAGRRPRYYADPTDDALLLSLAITSGSATSRWVQHPGPHGSP
jgi:[ribosomal protein S18]-alanine N-acetyltransferase